MTSLRLRAQAERERRRRAKGEATRRAHSERIAAWREDFPAFAAQLDIIPKGPRQKLRPNAIQAAFEVERSGRDIILKPRQVGITTWELARDIWFFLTRPDVNVVVVVQSSGDNAAIKEVSEKLAVMFESLENEGISLAFKSRTSTYWKLADTRSSLKVIGAGASEASAAKKGRAGTIHRLHITEVALFEYAAETLNAILECVPSREEFDTEIVIESTPKGQSGTFYERYQSAKSGRSGYKAHFFEWHKQADYQTPLEPGEIIEPENDRERELVAKHHVSPEQLKWYRAKVVDKKQDLVDQEYPSDEETCWLIAGRPFFTVEVTKALLAKVEPPLEIIPKKGGTLTIWERPKPNTGYIVAVDPSEGLGGDPGAIVVYHRPTGKHVATLHGQFQTFELGRLAVEIALMYKDGDVGSYIVVERNNHGTAVIQAITREMNYRRVYKTQDGKLGWYSTEVTRSAALDAFEDAHRRGTWTTNDRTLLGELITFVVDKTGKACASPGAHDDITMAAVIGWDVVRKPINPMVAALG